MSLPAICWPTAVPTHPCPALCPVQRGPPFSSSFKSLELSLREDIIKVVNVVLKRKLSALHRTCLENVIILKVWGPSGAPCHLPCPTMLGHVLPCPALPYPALPLSAHHGIINPSCHHQPIHGIINPSWHRPCPAHPISPPLPFLALVFPHLPALPLLLSKLCPRQMTILSSALGVHEYIRAINAWLGHAARCPHDCLIKQLFFSTTRM